MIRDCLDVFEQELKQKGEGLILDNYLPKDGTYLLIEMTESGFCPQTPLEIRYTKKTGEPEGASDSRYKYICHLDYYSRLVEMNKPIDTKKVIHSNSYLSFFLKKESLKAHKATEEIIDKYYEVLKYPEQKYSGKAKAAVLYEKIQEQFGNPDVEAIEKVSAWIKENLYRLEIDTTKKDYLKLFFVYSDDEQTKALYKREGTRYLVPNIYNNNEYNQVFGEEIFGLPNNNIGMSWKKVYLEHKSRKTKVPYLLNQEEVLVQADFFEYLYAMVSKGYYDIYFCQDPPKIYPCRQGQKIEGQFRGYYLRLQKGKEVEIHSCDVISGYRSEFSPAFQFREVISVPEKLKEGFEPGYGRKDDVAKMEILIDDVLFGKSLRYHYFSEPRDINIRDGEVKRNLLIARERLHNWFYKGDNSGVAEILDRVTLSLIKNSIRKGNNIKAKHQLNLHWSLKMYFKEREGVEEAMKKIKDNIRACITQANDNTFQSDEEYYFAVGQLVSFYLFKKNSKKKDLSMINPIINAKRDEEIKRRVLQYFKGITHAVYYPEVRAKRLTARVLHYKPVGNVDYISIATGYTEDNLILEKKEEK